jgi:hypothetical protein
VKSWIRIRIEVNIQELLEVQNKAVEAMDDSNGGVEAQNGADYGFFSDHVY